MNGCPNYVQNVLILATLSQCPTTVAWRPKLDVINPSHVVVGGDAEKSVKGVARVMLMQKCYKSHMVMRVQ